MRLRILLTGSNSHLAHVLLPILCAHPLVEHIAGIDLRPSTFTHAKFHSIQADLTQTVPAPHLSRHNTLIHLAWVVLRGKMPLQRMRAINIDASQTWLDCAAQLNLPHIIHLSSASVYGNGDDLDEHAPIAPICGFRYAEHKAELEHWLIHHHPHIIRLRPHLILGTQAQPLLQHIFSLPAYIRLPDPQPLLQCVHETDVAYAILLALIQPAQGAYNLAAADSFILRDAILHHHPRAIAMSPAFAQFSLRWLWRLTGLGGEPGWVAGADRSLTLDCSKAQQELGWQASTSSAQMILGRRCR